jgi:hypothetical protein
MRRTLHLTAAVGAALLSGATAGFAGATDQNPGTVLAQAQGTAPQGTNLVLRFRTGDQNRPPPEWLTAARRVG